MTADCCVMSFRVLLEYFYGVTEYSYGVTEYCYHMEFPKVYVLLSNQGPVNLKVPFLQATAYGFKASH